MLKALGWIMAYLAEYLLQLCLWIALDMRSASDRMLLRASKRPAEPVDSVTIPVIVTEFN